MFASIGIFEHTLVKIMIVTELYVKEKHWTLK